nr:phosphoribosylanthranilate isomerase [Lachnospiraceae bacterium]
KAVGVFVNEDADKVISYLNEGVIDIAQLHGDEDDDYILRVKNSTNKEVIKAAVVTDKASVEKAFDTKADYVLLDSGKGSGLTFDWRLISNLDKPYFLAGGLSLDNIGEVMTNISPYAVDVSSGIESMGHKDIKKMHGFAKIVRKEVSV